MDFHKYGIWKWEVIDGLIHINQDVDISGRELTSLPFKVYAINGDFNIKGNRIKKLENFPKFIKGNFIASYNEIESLEGFPDVQGLIFLENNNLRSLKGITETIQEGLDISNNPLESLEHAPRIENYVYLLHHGTSLDKIHLKIYKTCIEKQCWNPAQTIHDNLKKLNDYVLEKMYTKTVTKRYGL